jgi:hypothetical protein
VDIGKVAMSKKKEKKRERRFVYSVTNSGILKLLGIIDVINCETLRLSKEAEVLGLVELIPLLHLSISSGKELVENVVSTLTNQGLDDTRLLEQI